MKEETKKKNGAINGRLSGELRDRLDAIYTNHGVADSKMLVDALTALADYVERERGYHLPIKIIYAGVPLTPAEIDEAARRPLAATAKQPWDDSELKVAEDATDSAVAKAAENSVKKKAHSAAYPTRKRGGAARK